MGKNKAGRELKKWRSDRPEPAKGCVRIIGGKYRGHNLVYSGDPVTRPMKDNVREALFNLVGGYLDETLVIDLFGGTGVVGLEAISRGANHAFLIERHVPTTKIIRQNVESLELYEQTTVIGSDSFYWGRQWKKAVDQTRARSNPIDQSEKNDPQVSNGIRASQAWRNSGIDSEVGAQLVESDMPWAVFCCAPYQLYLDKRDEVVELLRSLLVNCPLGSLIVVECDEFFDLDYLPAPDRWHTRIYQPAVMSVLRVTDENIDFLRELK